VTPGDLSPSRRWTAVLDRVAPRDPRRRGGPATGIAVHELDVVPGRITARVAEVRGQGGQVVIGRDLPADADWEAAATLLASRIRWLAHLLDGHVAGEVEEVLAGAGIVLVPPADALHPSCSCGATACAHVRVVGEAFATAVARDPSILLRLAGRSRETLLEDVRRAGGTKARTTGEIEGIDAAGETGPRVDLRAIELRPAPVADAATLVAHLGDPPGVDDVTPFLVAIGGAAAMAWQIAAGEGSDAADRTVLLAQLRAGRVMGASELADALGWPADEVTAALEALHAEGVVLATGSDERRRYRAP